MLAYQWVVHGNDGESERVVRRPHSVLSIRLHLCSVVVVPDQHDEQLRHLRLALLLLVGTRAAQCGHRKPAQCETQTFSHRSFATPRDTTDPAQ